MDDNVLVDDIYKIKVAYYSDVQEDVVESSGFLIKKIRVKKINAGNSIVSEEYSLRLNSFDNLIAVNISSEFISKSLILVFIASIFSIFPKSHIA